MSKNSKLAYEAQEPAFLQKLRGHYGTSSGRLERPAARPRKAKNNDDDDDAPVYVDEESNEVISKEEYQALVGGGSADQTKDSPSVQGEPTAEGQDQAQAQAEPVAKQSNLTEVGGQRKRKQAKVVGEDKSDEKVDEKKMADNAQSKVPASRKPKKAKKIKLSFDEE
ncbi:hypothetical protein N7462_004467 [Penicillium macrosclerotiorum]|uniref:uncharacterized protein n=1 Tax=Penicillium macrosclerotiorum TaxID=303699 RepID=UPI0025491A93|nr:uncharacterized protein N7462_004467 [Penicillium macrosclerotiorum]KAJ5690075.1 hypothetical protein N7462_004467 [Penicillium macrosclerotiorum]